MAAGGCEHYRNEREILAPCCSRYFRCHRCHNSKQEDTCGPLDRSAIKRIRCTKQNCKLEQDPAAKCAGCGVNFAEYVCLDCSLYRQADPKDGLFHCKDCGICRVGRGLGDGGSHWHCRSCCACLSNDLDRGEHLKGLSKGRVQGRVLHLLRGYARESGGARDWALLRTLYSQVVLRRVLSDWQNRMSALSEASC